MRKEAREMVDDIPAIGKVQVEGQKAGGVPIGRISWFSVRCFEAEREGLLKKWTDAGLAEADFLPAPRSCDCFKQSVRILDARIRQTDGMVARFIVRYEEGRPHIRHIIREQYRKGESKPFGFTDIGTVTYHDENDTLTFEEHTPGEEPDWAEITTQIKQRYETLLRVHNDVDVRAALAKKLRHWHSLLLRPTGGVYFVPRDFGVEADAYAEFLRSIGSEMWSLVVSTDAVPLVKQKLEEHEAEVEKEMAEKKVVVEAEKDEKKKAAVQRHMDEEMARLKEMKKRYAPLVV